MIKRKGMMGLFLVVSIFLTPNINAHAAFKDVPADHWATQDIERLVKMGAIQGFEDGTYRLNDGVTRAQAAKIIVESLDIPKTVGTKASFKDVKEKQWYFPYVETLAARNIIGGFEDGTFRPNDKLTRAQMAAIISSSFQLEEDSGYHFKDVSDSAWYKVHVDRLATADITKGYEDGTFRPGLTVSRAHIAAFIIRGIDFKDSMNETFANVFELNSIEGNLDTIPYSIRHISRSNSTANVYTVIDKGVLSNENLGALGKGLELEIMRLNKETLKVSVRFYVSESAYGERKVKAVYKNGALHFN